MRPNFFHHLHPPSIPARQARLRYTLAAGGLAVFLVLDNSGSLVYELYLGPNRVLNLWSPAGRHSRRRPMTRAGAVSAPGLSST